MIHHSIHNAQEGFTLVEMLIAITIFSIVMAVMGSLIMTSQRALTDITSLDKAQTDAKMLIERIAKEVAKSSKNGYFQLLDSAGNPVTALDASAEALRFQRRTGVASDGTPIFEKDSGQDVIYQVKRFDASSLQYPNIVVDWKDLASSPNKVTPAANDSKTLLAHKCANLTFRWRSATLVEIQVQMQRTTTQIDPATGLRAIEITKPLITRVSVFTY
jgi:prepilin-type N-terminal cleavage/methylation domain-containing protein